ncbi:MAG: lipid-A-disaccharide synthase [Bacteroidales bacterium]|nr:lipid-A-disaccharide synthase [Bacteroidales bacterium]
MKYFLIAGEASGDLHASNLMKGLLNADPQAEFCYMGGDLMQEVSEGMVMHYRETSYMMLDVLFHLRKIFRNMRIIKRKILEWKPDVLIPVDYPGFNMRMARFASGHGMKVFYYISPKVWAWKQRRVKSLKKYVNRLFVIFPFEVDFFARFNMEVEYFGNPLVDQVAWFREQFAGAGEWKTQHGFGQKPLVALLAGSRKKEIDTTLPSMLTLAGEHPEYQFVLAGAPSIDSSIYEQYLQGTDVKIVYNETYALLECAEAGLVTSGTATLEAALFELPQVVLYGTSQLAYGIAKRLIKIKFISLVNLIYGKKLVEEVIQKDLTKRTRNELTRILTDDRYRKEMQEGYRAISSDLGQRGVSQRIGERMIELLKVELE